MMIKTLLVLLGVASVSAVSNFDTVTINGKEVTVKPTPGALSLSLNATSMENILSTFVPLMSSMMLDG